MRSTPALAAKTPVTQTSSIHNGILSENNMHVLHHLLLFWNRYGTFLESGFLSFCYQLEFFKKRISATLCGCSQYPLDGLLGGEVGPPWYEIGKHLGREFPWRQPPLPTGGTLDREPVMDHSNNSAIHSTFFKDKTSHKATKPAKVVT